MIEFSHTQFTTRLYLFKLKAPNIRFVLHETVSRGDFNARMKKRLILTKRGNRSTSVSDNNYLRGGNFPHPRAFGSRLLPFTHVQFTETERETMNECTYVDVSLFSRTSNCLMLLHTSGFRKRQRTTKALLEEETKKRLFHSFFLHVVPEFHIARISQTFLRLKRYFFCLVRLEAAIKYSRVLYSRSPGQRNDPFCVQGAQFS